MIKRVKEYDEQLYGDKQVWLDRRDMQYEVIARYRAKLKQRAELEEEEQMMSSLGDDLHQLHVVVSGLSDHCSGTPPYANTKQPPSASKPCALFHRLLYRYMYSTANDGIKRKVWVVLFCTAYPSSSLSRC
jgi:hypothetical protein